MIDVGDDLQNEIEQAVFALAKKLKLVKKTTSTSTALDRFDFPLTVNVGLRWNGNDDLFRTIDVDTRQTVLQLMKRITTIIQHEPYFQGKLKGYYADCLIHNGKCMDEKRFVHEYSLTNGDEIKVLAFHII